MKCLERGYRKKRLSEEWEKEKSSDGSKNYVWEIACCRAKYNTHKTIQDSKSSVLQKAQLIYSISLYFFSSSVAWIWNGLRFHLSVFTSILWFRFFSFHSFPSLAPSHTHKQIRARYSDFMSAANLCVWTQWTKRIRRIEKSDQFTFIYGHVQLSACIFINSFTAIFRLIWNEITFVLMVI